MISHSFYLNNPRKEETRLMLALRRPGEKRCTLSVDLVVPAKFWNVPAEDFEKDTPDRDFFKAKLAGIRRIVLDCIRQGEAESLPLPEVKQIILAALDGSVRPTEKEGVLSLYKKWATVGTARKLHPARQDLYAFRVFSEFVGGKDIAFSRITNDFYEQFMSYLRYNKEFKENTVGGHIKKLKAVMREGLRLKLHNNLDFTNFEKPSEEVDTIALSEEEISRIYRQKVSPMHEKARDIFVLGCYVAQRHGDYSSITSDDIHPDGIHITQDKTGRRIVIPAHPRVLEILDKYDGRPPHMAQAVLNRCIKEVAKQAGLTEKILISGTKAGRKFSIYKEKWQLVSTHTARRSGITNALLSGVPRQDCMYLSGHATESSFNKYVKISDIEYSRRLAESAFFSTDPADAEIIQYVRDTLSSGRNPKWLQMLREAMG